MILPLMAETLTFQEGNGCEGAIASELNGGVDAIEVSYDSAKIL